MHLHLIEGHSAFFRAFHTNPEMYLLDGTPCNAMYGYARMLWWMLRNRHDASHLAVVLDAPNSRNHRRSIFAEYKAQRPAVVPEMLAQLPRIREVTEAFGVPVIEVDGYEADDVIATYATLAVEQREAAVTIVTIDKDMAQMIGSGIRVYDPMILRGEVTQAAIVKKFGDIPTSAIPEAQALMGDKVDNIPGCPGIGLKTAEKLLRQFGSVEGIYENLDRVDPIRIRALLAENRAKVELSRQLVTLKTDVKVEIGLDDLAWSGVDHDRLQEYLRRHGFRSLEEEMAA